MMSSRAFTLVELLVVTLLGVVMIVVMVSTYMAAYVNCSFFNVTTELQTQSRAITRALADDLRRTNLSYVTIVKDDPVAGSDSITYRLLPDANTDGEPDCTFDGLPDWANGIDWTVRFDQNTGVLTRTDGSATTVIGKNLVSVRFDSFSTDVSLYMDELNVRLNLGKKTLFGKQHLFSSESVINMRN